MIRIYKQDDKKYVTKGAYETCYKPLGYKLIIENKTRKIEEPKVEDRVQLDDEVRVVTRRTRGSSNKKNDEVE